MVALPRLKNLQRLGLTPASPGKGNHQTYTYSDLCDYALALMLAEFGLEPRRIVAQIKRGMAASTKKGEYFCYYPEWFSKGRSQLRVMTRKQVSEMAPKLLRLAIINLDEIKWLLRADLQGISNEGMN